MGNRAVVIFEENPGLGVYLHWNGGPESVLAFLDATKEQCPGGGLVGFVQTVANFFNYDGLSLYIETADALDKDNGDNGTYYVKRLDVVRREFTLQTQVEAADLRSRDRERYERILRQCREKLAASAGVSTVAE